MNLLTYAYLRFQQVVEELPESVRDELPDDVVERLRDGLIDRIPEDAYENLSDRAKEELLDRVPDFVPESVINAVSTNPGLAAVMAIIGVVAVIGFMYGVAKSAFKAVVFFGVLAAVAWFLFAQNV